MRTVTTANPGHNVPQTHITEEMVNAATYDELSKARKALWSGYQLVQQRMHVLYKRAREIYTKQYPHLDFVDLPDDIKTAWYSLAAKEIDEEVQL
jgi:predicted naringenin-chalcone synthase